MSLCIEIATVVRAARAFVKAHRGHLVLWETCGVCGWEQIAIAPRTVPREHLECSRCHQMACKAKVVR